jgi:putative peptidoglycan lipid II flippase
MSNSIVGAVKRFCSGTLLSRVTGMVRDVVMAMAFGDHPMVAAFFVAFRLSLVLRRLLGEGVLQSAFIPHFEKVRSEDARGAAYFFRDVFIIIGCILCAIVLFVEGGLFFFGESMGATYHDVVYLTKILFPSLIFIVLYCLNMSVLQCYNSFFTSSVAPALLNIAWIAGVVTCMHLPVDRAMVYLAGFVVVGFFLEWIVTIPRALQSIMPMMKEGLFHDVGKYFGDIRRLASVACIGMLGIGAMQINMASDAIIARYADERGPVYLWYAIRLYQLPLAFFAIGFVNALLPSLSRAVADADDKEVVHLFEFTVKRIMALIVPCVFATFVIGDVAVGLIYGRGQFSFEASMETTLCLWAYSVGMIPSALVVLFSSSCYARKVYGVPAMMTVLSVVCNILFNLFFVFVMGWGAVSVALSTTISVWLQCMLLGRYIYSRHHAFKWSRLRVFFVHFVAASIAGSVAAIAFNIFLLKGISFLVFAGSGMQSSSWQYAYGVVGQALCFAAGMFTYLKMVRSAELKALYREFISL